MNLLVLGAIGPKFDKLYRVRGNGDEIFQVNVARLECSCPEWHEKRSTFATGDLRRVCSHVLEKLYTTKVEKNLTLLQQLFVRHGRTMLDCRAVVDSLGAFVVGQPFGPGSIRAIGESSGKPVLATFNFHGRDWSQGESPLSVKMHADLLRLMRTSCPEMFPPGV